MTISVLLFAWLIVFAIIGALVVLGVLFGAIAYLISAIKWKRWEIKNEKENNRV